ncbi:hypothetical protein [Corynebacterium aquatimens]|uniref:Uncharacterized protein n=1 Tax=Corynebacterium aquatimens TaxID=1190508 RepID=A0A931DY36_9CORY|nr:hypothetical protein [Corynebacterium aquatimens]MBG6121099.1 hypothetical protein [Corynebacterium aquatimens]WJY66344.1 hypothetical protein CAQUA_08250 [Corynebacterium aquatimens]
MTDNPDSFFYRIKRLFAPTGPTPEESLVGFFPDMDAAKAWATNELKKTGTNPTTNFVKAVKDIRTANPRIGLSAATHLVKQLTAGE